LALKKSAPESTSLARLYLASLVVPVRALNQMAAGTGLAPEVRVARPLDVTIGGVLKKKDRFRAGFAEHLAFWVRLSEAARKPPGTCALAQPNIQPEDKGHDGLSLDIGTSAQAELQSVKNSISNARRLVSTPKFRTKAVTAGGALLDDFWLLQRQNVGLSRLEHMLSDVAGSLGLTPDALAHQALVLGCSFNAVVVSSASEATPKLFDGYEHISQSPLGRIGTFIGSQAWGKTAGAVQQALLALLKARGVI
jgi:hypothetical protein